MAAHYQFLTPLLIGISLSAVQALGLTYHRRVRDGVTTYRYPPTYGITTLACGILFMYALYSGFFSTGTNDEFQLLCNLVVIWFIGSALLVSVYFAFYSVRVTKDHVACGLFWRKNVPFGEIKDASMKDARTLILSTRGGKRHQFFYPLEDLDLLHQQILGRLDQSA